QKFGKLTIIERTAPPEYLKDKKSIYFLCKCDCGNEKIIKKSSLMSGATTSCGCERKEKASKRAKENITHGMTRTKFYRIWTGMINRCTNPNYNEFHLYGG